MSEPRKLQVGDILYRVHVPSAPGLKQNPAKLVKVTKVGTKWIEVDGGHGCRIDKHTLQTEQPFYSYRFYYSAEHYFESRQKAALWMAIRKHVQLNLPTADLTVEELKEVCRLLRIELP